MRRTTNLRNISPIFAAATIALTALSGAAYSAAKSPAPLTARTVAARIDRVVQARFEANGGTFGEDRIVGPEGHIDVSLGDMMDSESSPEKKVLDPIMKSKYRVIMGILHLTHKPGTFTNVGKDDLQEAKESTAPPKDFHPSADEIEATGGSDDEAQVVFNYWARTSDSPNHLDAIILPYVSRVRRGQTVAFDHKKYYVLIAPLKAEHARCLRCHAGAHQGDTLGAMIYMVTRTDGDKPASIIHNGI